MPKLPSPYRPPEEHLPPDNELRAEAVPRDFQRTVNRQKYPAWYTLVRKVRPQARYEITSCGFRIETLSGQETLGRIRPVVDTAAAPSSTPSPASRTTIQPPSKNSGSRSPNPTAASRSGTTGKTPSTSRHPRTTPLKSRPRSPTPTAPSSWTTGSAASSKDDWANTKPTPDFQDVIVTTRSAISNGLALNAAANRPFERHPTHGRPRLRPLGDLRRRGQPGRPSRVPLLPEVLRTPHAATIPRPDGRHHHRHPGATRSDPRPSLGPQLDRLPEHPQ